MGRNDHLRTLGQCHEGERDPTQLESNQNQLWGRSAKNNKLILNTALEEE